MKQNPTFFPQDTIWEHLQTLKERLLVGKYKNMNNIFGKGLEQTNFQHRNPLEGGRERERLTPNHDKTERRLTYLVVEIVTFL